MYSNLGAERRVVSTSFLAVFTAFLDTMAPISRY
jgi:hypothetical protein